MASQLAAEYPQPSNEEPPAPVDPSRRSGWSSLTRPTRAAVVTCGLAILTVMAPPIAFVLALITIGISISELILARRQGTKNFTARCTLLLSSVLAFALLVGTLLLLNGAVVEGSPERGNFDPLPTPVDAPSSDAFVNIEAVGRGDDREIAEVLGRLDQQAASDTVLHVGTAVSALGRTDIYRWESLQTLDGEQSSQVFCVGTISTTPSSSCTTDAAEPTSVSWGSYVDGDESFHSAMVWNAPSDAVWMTAQTAAGNIITSNMADGFGYTEWRGFDDPVVRVQLVNASFDVIWVQTME